MTDYEYGTAPWFSRREEIKKVIIEDGVTNIGSEAFVDCISLTSVEFPNSVTSIGDAAFFYCSALTSVTIPNSVTSIGDEAFQYCHNLTSVTIPSSVTSIGKRAFQYCHSLTSVTIPSSVTSIGEYTFYDCKALTSVVIPNSVTSIGKSAFFDCSALTSITIPNSVTSIGINAFHNCSALTSITIPNSVTSIGKSAFWSCDNLTSVTIPNSATSIEDETFGHCKNLTSITIPNSVTSIGNDAFSYCSSLTSVEIPNSVTSIGINAFYNCKSLASVTIPNSVTSIGDDAFYSCRELKAIEIPSSVSSIGDYAFIYCLGLTSITFKGSTLPELGEEVFRGVNNSNIVYVPANSIEAYKSALEGSGVSNIQANPKQLFLNNSDSYTKKTQIDGVDVSFTRYFSGNWEPLYIPFSLSYEDWNDDFEVARINGIHQYDDNDDGDIDRTVLEFVKVNDNSVIYPSTPYIIKAKTPGEKTIYVENTTIYESEEKNIECSTTTEMFTFTGFYITIRFSGIGGRKGCYVLDDSGINIVKANTIYSYMHPYRWYMKREKRESAYGINNNNTAKEISIRVVGEETTGIADIQHTSPNTQTYDLNGRRVNENNLKPGMYVKNGRKFVVK